MDYSVIIVTLLNFVLLIAIIVGIYKLISKGVFTLKSFLKKVDEMDKKINIILDKLNNIN
ncbi:hypothetical protein FDB29_12370 [Clostridium botulinum]|nr:hypothetical protein [Clostridium botulinum]